MDEPSKRSTSQAAAAAVVEALPRIAKKIALKIEVQYTEQLALVQKERAQLILEAEEVLTEETKRTNKQKFPKYVVVREKEEGDE